MHMMRFRGRGKLLPPWNMPSDPVKAVFWFMHWLLQVVVRFFWVLVLAGVVTESILNGVVGGGVTLLLGFALWVVLFFIVNVTTSISQTVSEISRVQRDFRDFAVRPPNQAEREGRVVEGTITDLEEERRKRRRE